MRDSLLIVTPKGLFCPAGDFYIDPWKPVGQALITHAHSDHARSGSQSYFATKATEPILLRRLGQDIKVHSVEYGESLWFNQVKVSFHSAGHILGSAQIRLEYGGEVWVVTGDYKRQTDPTCEAFEPIPCDTLITEATFGLPIYNWSPTEEIVWDLYQWWMKERGRGRNALLACYSLGKAQRILAELTRFTGEPVVTHEATEALVDLYRQAGVSMVPTTKAAGEKLKGDLVIAPPSAFRSPWSKRLGEGSLGFASGWMSLRGAKRNRGYNRGFVISDHADWSGLLQTVEDSRAKRVLVTHGYSEELARFLREKGVTAQALQTLYEGEGDA